jgi:hypothetical protein
MSLHLRLLAGLAIALIALPAPARAQIRASELGSVMQVIDGTRMTIEYSRPRVRGRNPLWGTKAVHWGEVWTPGANWATTFEASKDVRINGQRVPRGKYSMWLVVREQGDWTLVLDSTPRRFHMNRPDTTKAKVRIPVQVAEAPFTEALTWSFPELRASGGTIAMQWEKKRVTMRVDVESSLAVTMSEADAKPFVGRWEVTTMSGRDSGKVEYALVTRYEQGMLKAEFDPKDGYLTGMTLIRVAPDYFTVGLHDEKGELYEVMRPDMMLSFKRVAGAPRSFELRDEADSLWGIGRLK